MEKEVLVPYLPETDNKTCLEQHVSSPHLKKIYFYKIIGGCIPLYLQTKILNAFLISPMLEERSSYPLQFDFVII